MLGVNSIFSQASSELATHSYLSLILINTALESETILSKLIVIGMNS